MKKTGTLIYGLVISVTSFVGISAQAQTAYSPDQYPTAQGQYLQAPTIYPSKPPDHYLPSKSVQAYSDSFSSTIYSPSQYPTAQGQYLQVPGTYRQQGGPPPLPPAPAAPISTAYPFPVAGQNTAPVQRVAQAAPGAAVSGTATRVAAAPTSSGAAPTIFSALVPAPTPAPPPSPVDLAPRPAPLVYPQSGRISASPVQAQPAPTSQYNSPLNPYQPPVKTASANTKPLLALDPTEPMDLRTGTGGEIGFQISQYHYQEHVDADSQFMHLEGATYGLTGQGSKEFTTGWLKDWFAEGQLRLSYGSHDYAAGNGLTASDIDDYMFEMRALAGHDFYLQDWLWNTPDLDLAPYSGLGFRLLFDDQINNTELSSLGAYRRYSHYFYLPLGSTERIRLTDNSRLSLNTEFDWLLYGWQVSQFGDHNPGASDLYNTQHEGYGLRGNLMYERAWWSVGPFFEYWNINQSSYECNNSDCGDEPHNQTLEYGLQAKVRF